MSTTEQNQAPLPGVLQRIGLEHRNMAKLLDLLERHVAVFEAGGETDYELLETLVDYFRRFPDACHHPKEDLIFARLAERNAAAATAVGDLPGEHEGLAEKTAVLASVIDSILKELAVPRQDFERAAHDFIETQRAHMRMEVERFFPAALAALDAEDWAEIDSRIDDPEDPVFGTGREERFEDLRAQILEWDETQPEA